MTAGFSTPQGGTFERVAVAAAGTVPSFENESSGDYRLAQEVSGIVDAGTAVTDSDLPQSLRARTLLNFDIPLGTRARPVIGAAIDIGAWEWGDDMTVVPRAIHSGPRPRTSSRVMFVDLLGRRVAFLHRRDAESLRDVAPQSAWGLYLRKQGRGAQSFIGVPQIPAR
jgi:hypothetical protein